MNRLKQILLAGALLFAQAEVGAHDRFVLFTMPKTGTFFFNKFLGELTGLTPRWDIPGRPMGRGYDRRPEELVAGPGFVTCHLFSFPMTIKSVQQGLTSVRNSKQFSVMHASYSPTLEGLLRKMNYKVIFVVRDPRDYIVSVAHFQDRVNKEDKPRGILLLWLDVTSTTPFEEILEKAIRGRAWYNRAKTLVESFIPWRHSDICCAVRFEEVFGKDQEKRLSALRSIASALEVRITDYQLLRLYHRCYGNSKTFRKAQSGEWKEYFTERHKALFKEELGQTTIDLGYETDLSW